MGKDKILILYNNINIDRLRSDVLSWINKGQEYAIGDLIERLPHPVNRVTLYLDAGGGYGRYILVGELPPFPEEKNEKRREFRQKYREKNPNTPPPKEDQYPDELSYTTDELTIVNVYNSVQENCAHIWPTLFNGCAPIGPKLQDIYEGDPPVGYREEWVWINVLLGEELDDDLVQKHTRCALYEEVDSEGIVTAVTSGKNTPDITSYIEKRKSEGAIIGDLIDELCDKKGPFRMTYRQAGHELKIEESEDVLFHSYKNKVRRLSSAYKGRKLKKNKVR
jgi:hypothetical protein